MIQFVKNITQCTKTNQTEHLQPISNITKTDLGYFFKARQPFSVYLHLYKTNIPPHIPLFFQKIKTYFDKTFKQALCSVLNLHYLCLYIRQAALRILKQSFSPTCT